MCTEDERAERQRALMLAAMTFGTVQQSEFMRTAEPFDEEGEFDSLVPEPVPEQPPTGRGRISLLEPDED